MHKGFTKDAGKISSYVTEFFRILLICIFFGDKNE